ncbi:MAG: hypothetical protein JW731_05810 [Bacteroidales bacterium]|nr:hypothetical protein [Bacteroidales bacterium]
MLGSKYFFLVTLILLGVLITGFSLVLTGNKSSNTVNPPEDFETFERDWKKVDSLVKKGLPQSALEVVEQIYTASKENDNHPQFIKATLYKIKLTADFQEEFLENTISDLKEQINETSTPVTQILHSIVADLYWRYYQANRFKLLDRTNVFQVEMDDIRTWDMKTLVGEVVRHYQASLNYSDKLKKINLKDYDPILEVSEGSKKYRPTLFDFLANRAADFFMQEESSLIQPVYTFTIDNPEYLADASDFTKISIGSKDTLALKYYALKVLQDLIRFHLDDEDPAPLVDVDLKRLRFVFEQGMIEAKDSLYLTTLIDLEEKYQDYPVSTDVSYTIAQQYYQAGQKYKPLLSDDFKWKIKEAYEKCREAIDRFPDSDGAKNCQFLLNQIEKKELRVDAEDEVLPNKPFLASVSYKNLNKIFCRIAKVDYEAFREMDQNLRIQQKLIEKYFELPVLHTWEQELPTDSDYQQHGTEIKIPGLQKGFYVLLFSDQAEYESENTTVGHGSLWVSEISFISQNSSDAGYRFYMLNRETGQPIDNVTAKIIFREYDYDARDYVYNDGPIYNSDIEGYFEIPSPEGNSRPNSYYIDFKTPNDRLVTGYSFHQFGSYPRGGQKETRSWFFTDRAIYRPGQTIYFKGIILDKENENYKVKSGFKTKVEFFDVNYQKISELDLVTNNYGSFNGSFVAPTGVLNGQMTIKNEFGSVNVQVEEYKRPNFEVFFNPVEGSYKLNETVTLTGTAKAFSGSNISGADVQYRVRRGTIYPIIYRGWYDILPPEGSLMEIVHGSTVTDENGNFTISFKAAPDQSAGYGFKRQFRYMVYATVTDINGESHNVTGSVDVSEISLSIKLDIKDIIEKDEFKAFKIATTNLNGQPVAAQGTLSIMQLIEPERLLRERLWETPDRFVMEKDEFKKEFPNDVYQNENSITSLKAGETVFNYDFNTAMDSVVLVGNAVKWKSGRYKVSLTTKDVFGEPVEEDFYFTLYSKTEKEPPVNKYSWFHVIKAEGEPGEQAAFVIGSKAKNVRALYEVVKKEKVITKKWIQLSNEQQKIEIPITEELRGGFSVNVIFVKNNRSYNNRFNVEVPFTNKILDFEFATFRDKLTPGQEEQWKIIIKGTKGDSVAAEMLATMYDASLDEFRKLSWNFELYQKSYGSLYWQGFSTNQSNNINTYYPAMGNKVISPVFRNYDQLNWFGFNYFDRGPYRRLAMDGMEVKGMEALPGQEQAEVQVAEDEDVKLKDDKGEVSSIAASVGGGSWGNGEEVFSGMQIRRDFRETAFFFPTLQTNENGEIVINFTAPESLTRWRMLGLAYTKDLKTGKFEKEVVTRKDLMVVPNAPRFFREGDEMIFSAKVVNMSDKNLSGEAKIKFFDTRTMEDITEKLNPEISVVDFEMAQGKNTSVEWPISIPYDAEVISYRIMAQAGNFSDGEEKAIPVLSNRMLVTESLPLPVKGNETKNFKFQKLLKSGNGKSTLKNHKLTLEFSSNPAWYAVQALPYVMESERESADNIFNSFYANYIAAHLVESKPKIKHVFDTWKNFSPDALLSNLKKNEELKSVILQETPWVLDATSETEQKQRIALLFDMSRMQDELSASLRKLKQNQLPNGAWPWFSGMRESRNITQNIVTGFGHLKQLGVYDSSQDQEVSQMVAKAVRFLDQEIKDDYDKLKEHYPEKMDENHLGHIQIQYLYARSYFMEEVNLSKSYEEAFNYFVEQAKKYWVEQNIYMKGMMALALNRLGEEKAPDEIMASVKEYALYSDEMGMYWRSNQGGYYWYQAPIDTQALLIEAFDEVSGDSESVEKMKIWLLKQKQTQNWKTGRATAEAVYALLLKGSDWLENNKLAEISLGEKTIDPFGRDDIKVEAGTGYFKTSWLGGDVEPEMGDITVTNKNPSIAWGAVYWQYFEDLDQIGPHETPLKLEKQLFREINTDAGPVLEPITNDSKLNVGNKIKVRIEIRIDRDLEYVHMKDMRASGFEPINVLSGYRYQGGLGYYETTQDASSNFYFDYISKGTYVFEYPLVVSQKGDFSNGITTIQCLYAPEFASHSKGIRVEVE